jgi:hypothetical protein
MIMREKKNRDILAPRTSISPYIPRMKPGLHPLLLDLCAGDAFIVPVIPFPDVLCYLDPCIGSNFLFGDLVLVSPGILLPTTKFKELKGALGTAPR